MLLLCCSCCWEPAGQANQGYVLWPRAPQVARRLGGPGAADVRSTPLLPSHYRVRAAAEASTHDARGGSGSDGEVDDWADQTSPKRHLLGGGSRGPSPELGGGGGGGGSAARTGRVCSGSSTASSSRAGGPGRHGVGVRQLSKYEATKLAEAQARHRDRTTHERAAAAAAAAAVAAASGSDAASSAAAAAGAAAAACAASSKGVQTMDKAGPSFVASPPEVVFTDIEAGVIRRAEVALINRGPAKGSIRLVDVSGEVRGWGGGLQRRRAG